MIRITVFFVSVVVLSTAEKISFDSCFYPDSVDGPSSANLIKTNDGFELELKFWANNIGLNSPLKVKLSSDYNSVTKLVHVLYPIQTSSTDNKYTEHKVSLPIPKMEINSDKVQLSLHKVSSDGNETAVWCMRTSIRVLNGMKDEVTNMPMPPQIAICPPMNHSAVP